MAVDLGELPDDERRRWLLDHAGELLFAQGSDVYLNAPLVEPTPAFFPDGWWADIRSVESITRRLMDYAGLEGLELEVVEFGLGSAGDDGGASGMHVAGFFAGIEDGVCKFGVVDDLMDDPVAVAGVMAHEVAHAYRAHAMLVQPDHELEEELTDLTCVHLGFGVLIANVAYRAHVERNPYYATLIRRRAGYLTPGELSFLLAAQAVVRADDVQRIARQLESSQAFAFREAYEALVLDEERLLAALRLPEERPDADRRREELPTRSVVPGPPWGRAIYRVYRRRVGRGVTVAGILGVLCVVVASPGNVAVSTSILALSVLAGGGWGYFFPQITCSAPCGAAMAGHERECPACLGFVVADLFEPPARLEVGSNRNNDVYRLRGYQTWRYAAVAGALILALGAAASPLYFNANILAAGLAMGIFVAGLLGRRVRRDECSDPGCGTVLPAKLAQCPRCLGDVAGEITTPGERLDGPEASR